MEYEHPDCCVSGFPQKWRFCVWHSVHSFAGGLHILKFSVNSFSMVLLKSSSLFWLQICRFWLDYSQVFVSQIIKEQLFLHSHFELLLWAFLPNWSVLFWVMAGCAGVLFFSPSYYYLQLMFGEHFVSPNNYLNVHFCFKVSIL